MFSTKLEVDKHVESCLKKINSENERNLRCLAFAKLYFKVGDYEQARRYASIYVNAKPQSAEAQQLLGKILEKQGKLDAALDAYRKSLELDSKQNTLVLKVCELLANDNVNFDLSGARYFCEKAQSIDPNNPSIYTLKERLIMAEGKDPDDVSRLLQKELDARPTDINIRIRLLRHLMQNNYIKEAYKHAYEIEHANLSIFTKSLKWYETVAEVLVKYQQDNYLHLNWEYWMLLVCVLDKLAEFNLDERFGNAKTPTEYIISVFNFDQTLKIALESIQNCPEKHLLQEFLNHYRGQLCFHLITLMFKQAKKELIKYKEASQLTLPLLFAAYHTQPVDLHCMWINHTTESNRELARRWNREASYRCSQVGHMLLSLSKERKSATIEKATQYSLGMWREQFLKKVFVTRDQQAKIKSSYFATCPHLVQLTLRLPEANEISKLDECAQLVNPDSLHHYIWLGLNQNLSTFKCTIFDGLTYSLKNLSNCSAESISILDIQAFLNCAVLCARQQIEDQKHNIYYSSDKPAILPASITSQLGTSNQANWLISAYKMFKNDYGCNFSEVRLTLIKGIETMRCYGNHGLDVKLLVLLARTFAERAKTLEKQTEIEFNDARAELYWQTALPLLEKLKNNQQISYSSKRLFEYKSKEMSSSEIQSYIDDGKLFSAIQCMKKKDHEKALQLFENLTDPYASYYQAQLYKMKAEEQTSKNKESVTSEMRSQNIILLSRARDCLYLTFDRVRDPSVDRRHPLNAVLGTDIDKIERMLSRIDPDTCNRNECDGMSDENVSSLDSMNDQNYTFGNSLLNGGNFTPKNDNHLQTPRLDAIRREARPSPERLDAQLKQLLASKDSTLTHILDQNKFMMESHKALLDAINTFTTSSVEEMRTLRTSIDDLKHSISDLQTIADVVANMKKEISDLKKDTNKIKNAPLNEEDLYGLNEEYNNDYTILNANNMPGLTQNMYQHLGKMAGNPLQYGAAAAAALYPGMYSMLPYAGLPLPQGGGLGYPDAHLPDFRNLSQGLPLSGSYAQGYSQGSSLNQGLPQPGYQSGLPQPGLQSGLPQPGLQTSLSQSGLPQPGLQGGLPQPGMQTGLTQPLLHQPMLQQSGGVVQTSFSQSILSAAMSSTMLNQPVLSTTTAGFPSLSSVVTTLKSDPATGFSSLSSIAPTNAASSYLRNTVVSKAPPVNVVITSSDPLPSTNSAPQPVLSVTIPPQHLKGNQQKPLPHNYQIYLPVTPSLSTPTVMSQTVPIVATQNILSNIAPPIYSAVEKTPTKNSSLGFAVEKSINDSFGVGNSSKTNLNSSTVSGSSVEEYDPCPNFRPIIPLPDEVPVNTGEEDETVLFEERSKLFRYEAATKEWKERGVGLLKLLKNREGKVRILMRRDQVHKICANHFITKNVTLTSMPNNDKAYIWAANDFAGETVVLEKLCARFKTPEGAKKFYVAFENARKALPETTNTSLASVTAAPNTRHVVMQGVENKPQEANLSGQTLNIKPKSIFSTSCTPNTISSLASLGGFVFTSTPTFKPKDIPAVKEQVQPETTKTSPFASFTFAKTIAPIAHFAPILTEFKPVEKISELDTESSANIQSFNSNDHDGSHVEEFKPSIEFKPVIQFDELNEGKTGDENAETLYASKAKLLRFEPTTKEWKEREIGQVKILKFDDTVRFLMQKEQVRKVCCNYQILKNTLVTIMPNNPKVLNWSAQDFSEGAILTVFGLRFKTEDQAKDFLNNVIKAQAALDENNFIVKLSDNVDGKKEKKVKGDTDAKKDSFNKQSIWGDKFKPKLGTWICKICYVSNDPKTNFCIACDSPKNDTVVKKETESGAQFSFGIKPKDGGFSFGKQSKPEVKPIETGFSFGKQTRSEIQPIETGFSFEKSETEVNLEQQSGWGNLFKPSANSWECQMCLVRNTNDILYCLSCENPKDDKVPKKDIKKGVSLETHGLSFSFGIQPEKQIFQPEVKPVPESGWGNVFKPSVDSWECKVCLVRNTKVSLHCLSCENPKDDSISKQNIKKEVGLKPPSSPFSFGFPSTAAPTPINTPMSTTSFTFGTPIAKSSTTFSFISQQPAVAVSAPALAIPENKQFTFSMKAETKEESKEENDKFVFGSPIKHNFEFTPRSPRRQSSGTGEEEDDSYVEEEEDNIYFKPVIPLPDKVDIKTGEENEEVLYCHRAKLFRFTDGEWKERGIGEVKILKHPDTGRLRVVMRREQIFKICLNHALTSDITYSDKDEKTWLFSAPDFSEGEIQHRQFCLRFKNAEVARDFKKAVENVVGGEVSTTVQKLDDSDVEVVYETTVTPEEEQEAIRLGLPPKFMAYRQLDDCACEQCRKDDMTLNNVLSESSDEDRTGDLSNLTTGEISNLTTGEISKSTNKPSATNTASIFGTHMSSSILSSSAFESPTSEISTPASTGQSEILKGLLAKPSILSGNKIGTDFASPSFVRTTSKTNTLETLTNATTGDDNLTAFTFSFKSDTPTNTVSNIFETRSQGNITSSGGLFSATTQPSSTIFSSASTGSILENPMATKPMFGGSSGGIFSSTTTSGNIFGGGGVFDGNKAIISNQNVVNTTSSPVANIFNKTPLYQHVALPTSSMTSIFCKTPSYKSAVTTSSSTSNIFQSPAGNLFGGTVSTVITPPDKKVNALDGIQEVCHTPEPQDLRKETSQTSSIFENKSTPAVIFGNLQPQNKNSSIFGNSQPESKVAPTSTSMFGSLQIENKNLQKSTPIFGNVLQENKALGSAPIFGKSMFGGNTQATLSFGAIAAQADSTTQPIEAHKYDEIVLKTDANLSFSALAENSCEMPSFATPPRDGDKNPFAFLGAGAPIFGSSNKTNQFKNKENDEDDKYDISGTGGDEEYDPHYEPIVPLPEVIVVSTGEEDEEILFNERTKLFRYDGATKEWKERGIGQLKVLHHPSNSTYRLLLRREQVHKVVLNQLITTDLDLQTMSTSDKAWCWGGYNYSEDGHNLEKLAARFKNPEMAKQFYDTVHEIITAIREDQAIKHIPATVMGYGLGDTYEKVSDEEDEGEYEDEDYVDYDDVEEEEDEEEGH